MSTEAAQKPKGFSPLLAIVAALPILGVLAGGGWQAYRHSQWRAFRAEQAKIEAIVETWQGPTAVADPVRWRAAWENGLQRPWQCLLLAGAHQHQSDGAFAGGRRAPKPEADVAAIPE